MIAIEKLPSLIRETVLAESRSLRGVKNNGINSLPEGALALAVGREIYTHRHDVFPKGECDWILQDHPFKSHAANPLFQVGHGDEYLYLELFHLKPEDTRLQDSLRAPVPAQGTAYRKVVAALLKAKPADSRKVVDQWHQRFPENLKPLGLPLLLDAVAEDSDPDKEYTWLQVWEMLPVNSKAADTHNIGKALHAAVVDMTQENMVLILRKIFSLRTNLEEEALEAEASLADLYKIAFAREQGVQPEEVYDPIAFAGYTDTELAAKNFLDDMQKTFGIAISETESERVKNLRDLALLILEKRNVTVW